ncbi:tRNA pseudouridine(55) synthase TruB [Mycoplasma capricolum]|uniref:tRNA pseudouridine synthase B n=1 Tax=Mycoplasma capricolum subsp. capricolum (strain California kid / ATCC 27343 / NCTC 10154) TaxID=340047 RepID=TRUB_MYCCT|nr:tRNA pseudouridine(55) synthase TruB [Mycoplasma capricolum]Q2SSF2.1 RecName: Full=tRNA pseudouridine synthase B; AltName: Full=tRNA pseudouridine(55) synthase; Short=Psi55 synthase; AltName: Full=tRNA pseudouridylate synthase; AltName: Full=tRNA-uridine isomerase [Mycoplasma capricolum subsp. capricolum ATCC 27343]ABC01192.1 tRNA pseudouridine synthase B, putative [Mycoplasma capricolum subsp. capricolum ATCC 27343]
MQKSGIFILNKPKNISTYQLINQVKKKLNIKKVGHCGTLDLLATGVVICLVNNATKISDYLLNANKAYQVKIKLFTLTDSYDGEGNIIQTQIPFDISLDQINKVISKYNNYSYEQYPPIYSSIKVNGKKLYQYALANQDVEIKSRKVTIFKTKLLNYDQKNYEIFLDVKCSKGTYIRSLAIDICKDLNTIGYVVELNRTLSGNFDINSAIDIKDLSWKHLTSIYDAVKINDFKVVKYHNILDVKQGKKIVLNNIKDQLVFISDEQNNILAVYQKYENNIFKVKRGGLNNDIY